MTRSSNADVVVMNRRWSEVLARMDSLSARALLDGTCHVSQMTPSCLTLHFDDPHQAVIFRLGAYDLDVQSAISRTLGFEIQVVATPCAAMPRADVTVTAELAEVCHFAPLRLVPTHRSTKPSLRATTREPI
jgi:hypothetical protein